MMSEFRAALQALVDVLTKDRDLSAQRGYLSHIDHACNECTTDPVKWPSVPQGWRCAYHAAKALLARPEPAADRDRLPDDELPDWEDLRARAPDATGELSSEAFVRKLRNAWPDYGIKETRPEPEPRITREEAIELLDKYAWASIDQWSRPMSEDGLYKQASAFEACLAAMLRPEADDICCLGFKDANECRCHREEQASAEKARENELADTPTPKAQSGTWTLVAPDGRQWKGESPIKAVRAEMRERVPAEVGLARILREVRSLPAEITAEKSTIPRMKPRTVPLDEDQIAPEERETGWLVENGMPSDIKYRFMDDDGPQWTRDPLKAIRFARRADAEMFAAGDDDAWRIVEHVFVSPPAASDGEKP